jgi:archaeosine-15-forming tRNA-guanine transglycosylase
MTKPPHVNEPVSVYGFGTAAAKANMAGAQAAMSRAAQRARQIAAQTGTDLIVVRAGRIVRVPHGKKISNKV